MWVLAMFDLPTDTKKARRAYGGIPKIPSRGWVCNDAIFGIYQALPQ